MSSYAYEAVDPNGSPIRGTINVPHQVEALRRVREMGLFPTRVTLRPDRPRERKRSENARTELPRVRRRGSRISSSKVVVFTRQTATLLEAGMPLLRGLCILQEQEEYPKLKRLLLDVAESVESGSSFSEALAAHPRVFNRLYLNMVRAGELGGSLDITLKRLADFMEKAQKLRGKVVAALFYPCSVLLVAIGVMALLTMVILPRFRMLFAGLLDGAALPAFTRLVLTISQGIREHAIIGAVILATCACVFAAAQRTVTGRMLLDRFKLRAPLLGPLFRKLAISRFARTLGTLMGNGVPILQALAIVQETLGNVIVGRAVEDLRGAVKEGGPLAPTLKASGAFPPMVCGMIDVGEQTGALPDMLMKVADNYEDEVDNATTALTSLLEPILIVFLAVVVGSIVIAMFLPLIALMNGPQGGAGPAEQ